MNIPITGSLFDEGDARPCSLVLTLAQIRPASREQRQFQRLVAQIELKRSQLKSWQTYVLRYNQRICDELAPLQAQLRAGQQQMVALIDELLTRPGKGLRLGRVQRAKLRAVLLNLLEGLLGEKRDAALEAMHDRYSDLPHEQVRQEMQRAQTFIEDVMDLHSDETQTQEHSHPDEKRFRAGSAKSGAKQAQRDEAAKEVGQSLREVFRKLVSALHPDREPDEHARQRKTVLMQQVNQAYEARDLLTLLTLQLEIEQISAASLSAASRERLTHYNHILREQLIELDRELEQSIAPFRQGLGSFRGQSVTIADVDRGLSAACAQLSLVIRQLQADMVAFRDPERLRHSLKHFELEPERDELDDLTEFMATLQAKPRRTGRRRS
jgi:hypothetical protein